MDILTIKCPICGQSSLRRAHAYDQQNPSHPLLAYCCSSCGYVAYFAKPIQQASTAPMDEKAKLQAELNEFNSKLASCRAEKHVKQQRIHDLKMRLNMVDIVSPSGAAIRNEIIIVEGELNKLRSLEDHLIIMIMNLKDKLARIG